MRRLPIVLAAFLFSGPLRAAETGVGEISAWLAGTFDNREQASRDPAGFPETRLVSVLVPRSRIGLGAAVLYVEEAPALSTNRPFVRRFWRIEDAGAGKFVARVFEPKDPIAVSGKWRDAADLALFGLNDVLERPGCLLTLRKVQDHYDGVSEGIGCPWPLGGARYLVSRVDVYAGRLDLWERGFDGAGRQVWGTVKGPTLFLKRSDSPPLEPSPLPISTTTAATNLLPAPPPTPGPQVTPIPSATPLPSVPTPAPAPAAPPSAQPASAPSAPERAPSAAPPLPVLTAVVQPPFPSALLTPSLLVRGLGAVRNLDLAEIRALPTANLRQRSETDGKKGGVLAKGVPLIEILRRCGLRTDGTDVRRLLAPAVVLATGSNGYAAAFSIEELLTPGGGAILVVESPGKEMEESEGPFRIVEPAKIRSVNDVRSLELRILATNPPESKR